MSVGVGTVVWPGAHVRDSATIGPDCVIGRNVYIDAEVVIGENCKIADGALIYQGAILEDGVFIGPGAIITNDRQPRAINPGGSRKTVDDWTCETTLVKRGASIGAGAIIIGGLTIGEWAMVGAGSVVTHDVPGWATVKGNPAR